MNQRYAQREQDLSGLLEQTRMAAIQDMNATKAMYQAVIAKKNDEINVFRTELDSMLQTLAQLNYRNAQHGVVYVSDF